MKRSIYFCVALAPLAIASALPARATPGLGFDVTARIAAAGKSSGAPQVVQAHVLLSGQRARIDTSAGRTRAIVLYSPPFVYRLLPDSKAGVKWNLSKVRGGKFGGFDPQQLLRNPSQIRASLVQNGAKLTGRSQIGGVPVDVYEQNRPGQSVSHVKAWIRRADSLPLRFEAQSGGLNVVATWSRYTHMANAPASKFAVPKGFSIREAQNPPLIPLL